MKCNWCSLATCIPSCPHNKQKPKKKEKEKDEKKKDGN